ncbi:prosaposin-like [Struthio camelus]|uniref:prosaposin-like n=1 Tax=Struthio camelus TaxID=8801 RepID=UPI0036042197
MESKWSGWVLILSICLGSYQAGASPVAGKPECGERPQDWCRDARTAARCGALEHCRLAAADLALVKGIPCHLCQVMVSVMGKILQDNCTEDKLRVFLEKKCQYLPFQDWSVKCKKMVDTGILVLTQLGKQVLADPKVVCGTIKLCQPRRRPTGALKFLKPPASPEAPGQDFAQLAAPFLTNVPLLLQPQDLLQVQGDLCGDCARLVAAVQGHLDTNAVGVQTFVARLRGRCESLGPLLAARCQRYLAAYSDVAARLLQHMQAEDPQELCGLVGACASPGAAPALRALLAEELPRALDRAAAAEEATALCQVCELAVKAAESLLENNVTEEQLVNDMEKVCYMLPHGVIGQCKDFVDSYGKAVVIMLLEATDPQALCTMLRCCPKAPATAPGAGALERLLAGTGAFCNVCQLVITYFDNELLKNDTLSELGDMLEKGCELLPPPFTGKCEALVTQYEPAAVRLLVQMMDPTFVCTKIRACDSPEEEPLGAEPCARGPGYWCKSAATAAECNALEHCKRHVWH